MPKLGLALSTAAAVDGKLSKKVWDAYSDFYLSPTAAGWSGATSPSTTGAAWGYYMGNVNGNGFPASIGTYLNSGQIYKLSDANPADASDGTRYSNSAWYNTGGAGFATYLDNIGWGVSLGRYDNAWFGGAPGLSQGLSNLIWMQAAWLSGPGLEGIASVLTWKAPANGTYTFSGLLVTGNQPSNNASVAVVDSLGSTIVPRTILTNDTLYGGFVNYTKSYSSGDIIQIQVGSNMGSANAIGLNVNIST